jgi:hypothetical protein
MPQDLRKYASLTNKRLIIGALVLFFVVGLGLIAWIYGSKAALFGFLCMLGGLVPIGLAALVMYIIGIIVKKNNQD